MRVAVVSDVHANLPALEAVLAEVDVAGVDEVWCLGDIVGYGPDPGACVEIIRDRCAVSLSGNHDLGAIGAIPIDDFNPYAAEANLWTGSVLSREDRAWLGSLPARAARRGVTLAHGSPREPVWEYVLSEPVALASFGCFETQWCLVGHSHVPMVIVEPAPGGKLHACSQAPAGRSSRRGGPSSTPAASASPATETPAPPTPSSTSNERRPPSTAPPTTSPRCRGE